MRYAEYHAITRLQADAVVTIDSEMMTKAADIVPCAPLEDLLTNLPE